MWTSNVYIDTWHSKMCVLRLLEEDIVGYKDKKKKRKGKEKNSKLLL